MSNLNKIQKIAAAMNSGVEPAGVFLYKLGTASNNPNTNEEHQVFTNTKTPRRIGSIGKVGGVGQFVAFEHVENGQLVSSL